MMPSVLVVVVAIRLARYAIAGVMMMSWMSGDVIFGPAVINSVATEHVLTLVPRDAVTA